MTVHFEQGHYRIIQDSREVGQLVAVDAAGSSVATEYFFLYQDVSSTNPTYKTYTTPSSSGVTAGPGEFHQRSNTQWLVTWVGTITPATFNAATFLSNLQATLGSSGTVKLISAEQISPCPEEPGQIWWGEYTLSDQNDVVIGAVNVLADGLNERWDLKPEYVTPGPSHPSVTIKFQHVTVAGYRSKAPFCVKSSAPTVVSPPNFTAPGGGGDGEGDGHGHQGHGHGHGHQGHGHGHSGDDQG